jgi:hypothetical protein
VHFPTQEMQNVLSEARGGVLRLEGDADALLELLKRCSPDLPAVKVPLTFANGKGFGVRVKPKSQSVSYLYYHNGLEWHSLREDGITKTAEIGWRPEELQMVAISIIFLAGQLAADYPTIKRLGNMQELADEKEETFLYCLAALTEMSSDAVLKRDSRKWASEAAVALDAMN